jgi:type III pantothenate kinase
MSGPALLFDVGNTRLKWGVLSGDRLTRTGSIRHEKLKESGFSSLTTKLPTNVDEVLVSNVAGAAFGSRLAGVIGLHCGTDVHFVHSERSGFGVRNGYRQARRLGVDRWVALVGARAEAKGALCVVDAGTALTIDALDRDGNHLGGQIVPGLDLMAESLEKDTSDIGAAPRSSRDSAQGMEMFAKTTRLAVRAGAANAVCGAVERAVRVMRSGGYRPKVILTGGDASRILKQLDGKVLHRPHLVLQGLACMLRMQS